MRCGSPRRAHRYLVANQVDQFLAYLALRAGWVTRDELVFLFWSDRVDAVGRRYLRKLLHRARQEIGAIETEGDRVRWLVDTDVRAWRDALDEPDVPRALALSRGPLLEGLDLNVTVEFGDWLETERSQTQRRLSDAVVVRSRQLEHDAPEDAITLATTLLALDPLDERAVQCTLRALASAGRTDALEPTHRYFADRLALELGGEPLAATWALTQSPAPDPEAGAGEPPPVATWPPQVSAPWGITSFVGRRAELTQLDECLTHALAGRGSVVAVEGEAGGGKTRLIEHFLSHAPTGVARFAARGYECDLSAPPRAHPNGARHLGRDRIDPNRRRPALRRHGATRPKQRPSRLDGAAPGRRPPARRPGLVHRRPPVGRRRDARVPLLRRPSGAARARPHRGEPPPRGPQRLGALARSALGAPGDPRHRSGSLRRRTDPHPGG